MGAFPFIIKLEKFPAGPNKMRLSVSQIKRLLQSSIPAAQSDVFNILMPFGLSLPISVKQTQKRPLKQAWCRAHACSRNQPLNWEKMSFGKGFL